MKESFKNKEEPRMNRRRFLSLLSGGMSGVAFGGVGSLSLLKPEREQMHSESDAYDPDALGDLIEGAQVAEPAEERSGSIENVSNSKHFIMEIVAQADRYERELPVVLQFAYSQTQNDPEGRTRMQYLQEMLDAPGVPSDAMKEIKKQIVGLGFEESRFDASRESSEQARGILQIIPSTWDDLSREGENVYSLVDQTRVAGELFSQTYTYLQNEVGDELRAIEAEFFNGDHEVFAQCFVAPVLINAYNAGMGTMGKLIHWFARTYGTEESTIGLFGQETKLSGYDVFMVMAKQGNLQNAVPQYQEDASAYTFKVYGAALCLLRHPEVTQS